MLRLSLQSQQDHVKYVRAVMRSFESRLQFDAGALSECQTQRDWLNFGRLSPGLKILRQYEAAIWSIVLYVAS